MISYCYSLERWPRTAHWVSGGWHLLFQLEYVAIYVQDKQVSNPARSNKIRKQRWSDARCSAMEWMILPSHFSWPAACCWHGTASRRRAVCRGRCTPQSSNWWPSTMEVGVKNCFGRWSFDPGYLPQDMLYQLLHRIHWDRNNAALNSDPQSELRCGCRRRHPSAPGKWEEIESRVLTYITPRILWRNHSPTGLFPRRRSTVRRGTS